MYPHIPTTAAGASRPNRFGHKKTNWLTRFIARINPANWFNELSQFEISMEELSSSRSVRSLSSDSYRAGSREDAALRDCKTADPITIG